MSEENLTSGTPDGAPPTDPAEMMTREHARKLIGQRDTLKHSFDALKFDFDAQAAELEKLRAPAPPTTPPPTPDGAGQADSETPEWAKALSAEVKETRALFTQHQASTAADAVMAEVLKSIPDGNKATATALVPTLGVDFTQPGAAADALAKLQKHHAAVMVDYTRGPQPRAPQSMPDGSLDFSAFKTLDDVPDTHKVAAIRDEKFMSRVEGKGSGPRSDGHPI